MSMSYPHRRTPTASQSIADDRSRLALLWRAFEEAEERIRELERESDERPGRALQPRPASEEGTATRAALARIEQEAGKRHEALLASIAKLDAEIAQGSAENAALRQMLAAAHARHADLERQLDLQRSGVDVANIIVAEERETQAMLKDAMAHASGEIERLAHIHEAAQAACAHAESRRVAAESELARWRERPSSLISRPHRLFPVEATRASQLPTITGDEVARLRAAGVNMADALLYADLTTLAGLSGIGIARIWKLRTLAEIMTLHGIGPDWALRLFQAGVRGIDDVARMGSEELCAKIWSTYASEGLADEARIMLERTLPGRCAGVVAAARAAMEA